MSSFSIKLLPEVLRSRAASTFTGSYQTLGSTIANPTRILKFQNNTNQEVTVSWDGTNDHEFLPAGSFLLLDVTTNKEISQILNVAIGTQFYVKGSAGTGTFYLSTYYAG